MAPTDEQLSPHHLIIPDWPAPSKVHALSTTRGGGTSIAPFDSLNLGDHVGDAVEAVIENRARLRQSLHLPAEPCWLQQVHGTRAVLGESSLARHQADACYTQQRGVVCAVLTADCLPLLLCDSAGTQVAAVHAGWRGLASGVIESALENFAGAESDILAWLGPAIGPRAFEVGDEVRTKFIAFDRAAASAFIPARAGHWLADLYALARLRLAARGVTAVYGGDFCTYTDAQRFYSYRRDGTTGRMASLIWLKP